MHPNTGPPPLNSTIELLTTYNELNLPTADILSEEPSPLEYMRYVARNRPFVVRRGAADWTATKTWNVSTLKELLMRQSVNVAVTPKGNADAPAEDEDGELLFVKPWEEQQLFEEFVDFVSQQQLRGEKEIKEVSPENDNLRNEYSTLFSHVEKDIPWARIALQQSPEAINLWIGNSYSTTALHKDNYENIYVQIIGQKRFVLLPPSAHAAVNEKQLLPASYVRRDDGGFEMRREEGERIPFATWDPDSSAGATQYSQYARPLDVTLEEGDMLYLPALWYDMDFGGSFYPLCNFARSTHLSQPTS
ncbi:Jumonji domain-containing 7 [Hyphodiscus hymeniophilus]|uniref:Jumonji domain-containing 7 n=1 Tax=Hyphodiscus hymeniophilus TaxID=353542 RepID=A0A9P7AX85_9HELO|nr:Jumonji domain-containing 7 [Hyphodiscus hymeniophilus]